VRAMINSTTNTTDITLPRKILNQMALGAYRMLILLAYVAVGVCFIGLLYLIFKSGIIPTVEFKTAKHAGAVIKPIADVWM